MALAIINFQPVSDKTRSPINCACDLGASLWFYVGPLVSVLLIEEIQLVIGWQRVYLCLRIFKQLIERRFLEKSEA